MREATRPIPELSEKDKARFIKKLSPPDSKGCIFWSAGKRGGYGIFTLKGEPFGAHRVAWLLKNGEIPPNLIIRHTCDNPSCVNPEHMLLGTDADNVRDRDLRGRAVILRGDDHYSRQRPEVLARGDRHGSRVKPWTVTRGEKHKLSRLNPEKVLHIRATVGEKSNKELAEQYGVTATLIYNVRKNRTWKHLLPTSPGCT